MPGRNASEADRNFASFFRESISVLSTATLIAADSDDKKQRLLLHKLPVKLDRAKGRNPLYLSVLQRYRISEKSRREFKVATTAYAYSVFLKENTSFRELVAFHWHPDGPIQWPHVHVIGKTLDGDCGKIHLPTGRVCIEDFVKLLNGL